MPTGGWNRTLDLRISSMMLCHCAATMVIELSSFLKVFPLSYLLTSGSLIWTLDLSIRSLELCHYATTTPLRYHQLILLFFSLIFVLAEKWLNAKPMFSGTVFTKLYFLRNLRMRHNKLGCYTTLVYKVSLKHFSFLSPFLSYEENEVLWIRPLGIIGYLL